MADDPKPGPSGTNQARKDSIQKIQDDEKEKPNIIVFDPEVLKKVLSDQDCLNKGGFKRVKGRLEYACQNVGLEFRKVNSKSDQDCFFTAICDQITRINCSSKEEAVGQCSPERLREELLNFLASPKNWKYQGSYGQIRLEAHLDTEETREEWLTKMREGGLKADRVTLVAMAILKRRNIHIITSACTCSLVSNHQISTIPCLTEPTFNQTDSILLGYYGKSRFVSLQPVVDINRSPDVKMKNYGTTDISKKIEMTPVDVEEYQTLYKESKIIDVKSELASEQNDKDDKETPQTFGTMIRKTADGTSWQIPPSEKQYIDYQADRKYPSPVFSYEERRGEVTVKWQWHSDPRHVATTVHVAGVKFNDPVGVTWCESHIMNGKDVIKCKQYVWVRNRIDKTDSQDIKCLVPYQKYRIFIVDHFRTTMHLTTIVRKPSDMMYYTPEPQPLLLKVINTSRDEEVMLHWMLKSSSHVKSVEVCIKSGVKFRTCTFNKTNKTIPSCFVLNKIKENIKVTLRVLTKIKNGYYQLLNEVELFIMHPPEPKHPELNSHGYWNISEHRQHNIIYRQNNSDYVNLSEVPVPSDETSVETDDILVAVLEMHELRCGAIACQRSSKKWKKQQASTQSSQYICILKSDSYSVETGVETAWNTKEDIEPKEEEKKHMEQEEKTRIEQEMLRMHQEKTREDQEKTREDQEKMREDQEKMREDQEKKREDQEKKRIDEEEIRVDQEKTRVDQEKQRRRDEKRRLKEEEKQREAEKRREEAEKKREEAEKKREEAEEKRKREEEMREENKREKAPKNKKIRQRRNGKGYFRILWRRPVEVNPGLMYLSPYT